MWNNLHNHCRNRNATDIWRTDEDRSTKHSLAKNCRSWDGWWTTQLKCLTQTGFGLRSEEILFMARRTPQMISANDIINWHTRSCAGVELSMQILSHKISLHQTYIINNLLSNCKSGYKIKHSRTNKTTSILISPYNKQTYSLCDKQLESMHTSLSFMEEQWPHFSFLQVRKSIVNNCQQLNDNIH